MRRTKSARKSRNIIPPFRYIDYASRDGIYLPKYGIYVIPHINHFRNIEMLRSEMEHRRNVELYMKYMPAVIGIAAATKLFQYTASKIHQFYQTYIKKKSAKLMKKLSSKKKLVSIKKTSSKKKLASTKK